MKRFELFKKTGITITAMILSGIIASAGPAMTVGAAAAEETEDPSLGATMEAAPPIEPEEENSEGESSHKASEDPDDDGAENEDSESSDTASGQANTGSSVAEEDPDPVEEKEEKPETGDTEDSSEEETDDPGDSQTGSSGTGNTGSSEDGGTDDPGEGSSESGSGKTGSGSGSSDSGSGRTDASDDSKTDKSGGGKTDGSQSGGSEGGSQASGGSREEADERGDGQADEEGTRKPIISDSSNIPYAGGVSEPTLDIPDNDPFAEMSAPSAALDNSLPATPGAPSSYTQASPGPNAIWSTAASLQGQGTILNPNEFPAGYSAAANYRGTNEQLIASQNIVSGLSIFNDGFRFYTIDKNPAVSLSDQPVYEEMNTGSRQIGQLKDSDVLYILSEENDNWLYVESGNVRGFVPASQVEKGADAEASSAAGSLVSFARETIPAAENKAYAYKRCTTKSTVIDKQYAVANSDVSILEEALTTARQVGQLTSGSLCYIILQADQEWAFVESGNVRGFVPVSSLTTGSAAKKIVQRKGEASMSKAQVLIAPADNAALYYSLNSTQEGAALSSIRSDIVKTASECIGSPYKWGGNSLKGGCDCSGFVKQLYALYGYNLPRVADAQSRFGTQIPIGDAAPGDLIFFASNGYVYHVAMYAGDGMTIEAFSEDRGIIATSIGSRDAVWATRIISD